MSIVASSVRAQLSRLLASPQLVHAEALSKLLQFVVEQALQGRGDDLKETRLGLEVFGRRPTEYDAATDPIVRVQMGRLRLRLHDYYAGHPDRVIIEIPKGAYAPVFKRRETGSTTCTASAAVQAAALTRRIAVLPFVNMSPEPDTDYISDGLTEELINVLARDAHLQVVARTSTFQFKQQSRDVREIGRQLDVGQILEGSVRQSGQRVRITAQLINVADGCHVWSERYDRELTDLFAVHEEIAQAIHGALRIRLGGADLLPRHARRPGTLEAYNEYLRGRHLWNSRTALGLRRAIKHFAESVRLDSQSARAYAGMADCHLLLGLSAAEPPESSMPQARAAAQRALELNPQLAEAHTSLAAVYRLYERDHTAAMAGFFRAESLDPGYATAHHWNGLMSCAPAGHFAEAVDEIEQAVALDPLAVPILSDLGLMQCFANDHAAAGTTFRRALELEPHFHRPYWFNGLSLALRGKFAQAEEALLRARALCPDEAFRSRIAGALGYCYGRASRLPQAAAQLRELTVMASTRYIPRWDFAQIHAGLGDAEAALTELEAAVARRESYVFLTPVWPTFRELRKEPRFCRLVMST